jgi:hypothetical protein
VGKHGRASADTRAILDYCNEGQCGANWPVLGGAVRTVPGTVGSAPEKDPKKVFIGGKWAVGTPGMEFLSEGIQTHTPLKPRGLGPT